MIRILHFTRVINRYDFIDNIVQRADPQRFQVGACAGSVECNIATPVYTARTPRWVIPWKFRREIPRVAWQLAKILRRWKADILHTHHYDEAVIGWLATRIHPQTRLVIGRHYSDAIYRSSRGLKRRALLALEHLSNQAAVRIIVPSTYIAEILTKWQRIGRHKIDIVPYGFVTEKYIGAETACVHRLREELGLNGQFVIGNFSRLHEEKGHRFLIEAMAQLRSRLPTAMALVVGDGPERSALEQQAAASGLNGSVRFLGWRRDAMTLMAAVDAVVQPTLQEAFSQVMAEALWMRKPLVITDVSGAQDIIQDGENGLLVPKGDAAALAGAIERLARNADLREQLAAVGRRYAEQNLTIERVIPRYERAYLQAMKETDRGR